MVASAQLTSDSLRDIGALSGLPDVALQWLLEVGSVSHLSARRTLSSLQSVPTERYCFVVNGALAITKHRRRDSASGSRHALAAESAELEYIGYLECGACFSDRFLSLQKPEESVWIDCHATHSTTLLQVETMYLEKLGSQYAEWRVTFLQRLRAERSHFIAQQAPSRRIVQDFFLRQNYSTSSLVRVTVRDHCMSCDKCFRACAARHGAPRMVRVGASLGRLSFPVVCRNCHEKPCLTACRLEALVSDTSTGEVRILDSCTGCGLCAKACPNGAITLVDRPQPSAEPGPVGLLPPKPEEGAAAAAPRPAAAQKRRRRAVKCDNCAGFPDRACLTACPTGALMEILPDRVFLEEELDPSTRARRFSDGAFVSGAPVLRQKPSSTWYNVFIAVLLVALIGVGIEAFLRATQPELSLTAHFVGWAHLDWTVTYSSGRGFGHWLGYLGTVSMLLSVLYSLRTRVKRFGHLGRQSTWLSAHLWLGFIGGTLVTYHSELKLDRWASIACILIWVILITGAVGRYLYGGLQASVGLAEFELRALRTRLQQWSPPESRSAALRTLLGEPLAQNRRSPLLIGVFWQEVRDRALLVGLRVGGARSITDPGERRQFLHAAARWAESRRRASYYHRAEAMLRHWNIIHIVLAIVMFALAFIHIVYGFVYKVV